MRVRREEQPEQISAINKRADEKRRGTPERDEYMQEWHAANPDKRSEYGRRAHRLRRYGLTDEDYEALYKKQDGSCAICSREDDLVIDHEHDSGNVRGLLCRQCNFALGLIHDRPSTAIAAAVYLLRSEVELASSV